MFFLFWILLHLHFVEHLINLHFYHLLQKDLVIGKGKNNDICRIRFYFNLDGSFKGYAFNKSVIKNVLLGTRASKEKAEQFLSQMEISEFANKNAKNLSGGELQKVALCRVLVRNSSVLLLDEPTSEMDLHSTNIAENAILDYIKKEKATLIFSTHSPSQARKLADRIIILNNGVIVEDGSMNETINAPKTSWGEEFLSQWIIKR